MLGEPLAEAEMPGGLASAADNADHDQIIKSSHHEAFDEVGDVGTRSFVSPAMSSSAQ